MRRQITVVDAMIIQALISTNHEDGKRDPERRQAKNDRQFSFRIKVHIGNEDE